MPGRFHFLQDRLYFLVGADDVGRSFGSHVLFPIHAFLDPDLVRLDDFVIRVAQQRKRKTMLVDEFQMTFRAVDAHAKKFCFGLKFAPGVAQFTSLSRAPWGAVLRIKIKNQC